MPNIKMIQGYTIKDEVARNNIDALSSHVTEQFTVSDEKLNIALVNVKQENAAVAEDINKEITRGKKSLAGVKRKILAMTGSVNKSVNYVDGRYYTVTATEDNGVYIQKGDKNYPCKMFLNANADTQRYCEIVLLDGYNIYDLYSTFLSSEGKSTSTSKTLKSVQVDGIIYTDFNFLKTVGFKFENMLINYTDINSNGVEIETTLMICSDGFKIIESVADTSMFNFVTTPLRTKDLTKITYLNNHNNFHVFKLASTNAKQYIEKIETYENTIIKTVYIKGVL